MADLIGTQDTTEEDVDMTTEEGVETGEEVEPVDEAAVDGSVGESGEPALDEEAGLDEADIEDEIGEGAIDESAEILGDEQVVADAVGETSPVTPAPESVSDDEAAGGDDEEEVDETPIAVSPYDMPGDWYVIHSYSGYENKVKVNLESRISSMHMEDRIFEVHIPMEDVVEIKNGKKVTVPRKVFPGYILVRMTLDDDSWYAVRNTPGVTGFVGGSNKPTPLSRREVERFLGFEKEAEKPKPRFKPEWEVGEVVRVVMGPFADFNGKIEGIDLDQSKVTVLVNIFGRDTPVELGFGDIQKG